MECIDKEWLKRTRTQAKKEKEVEKSFFFEVRNQGLHLEVFEGDQMNR